MSVYREKLLELKSIDNELDQYFLKLRFSFEQDVEMYWEIDKYTAENLKSVINFDNKYRYRLSFNSSWDTIKNQYIGKLTQTYCEHNDGIYFLCSDNYINNLNSIKQIQHINDLNNLTFITKTLLIYNEQPKEELELNIMADKHFNKFTWKAIAIVSVLFIMFFGLLSHIYFKKPPFNHGVLAQSVQFDNEISEQQDEDIDTNSNLTSDSISSKEPTIPFFELDKTITYSIPEGNVALTFDDGPSEYSIRIMNVLKEYEVGGTFFFTGNKVKKYPDYVRDIQANGYSIGGHSMNHANMPKLSYTKQEDEVVQTIKLLQEINNEEIYLFRPPYGYFNKQTKDIIHEYEYKMVLWNNDPRDWETRDADRIFNDIKNSKVSGSIIILHESRAVLEALPRIIEHLKEIDLQIVNLK